MKVRILSRSGKEIVNGGLQVPDNATVDDLQKSLHAFNKKWYASRQRLTYLSPIDKKLVVLETGKKLSDYFQDSGEPSVTFKDLGPQIGYKTVFFWEYFGPLFLYSLFYFFPQYAYPWSPGGRTETHHAQTLALCYWSFHYLKRIAETFLVHRFSHGTMPIFNLYRNCAYYWLFGIFVAYFINHPLYTPARPSTVALALSFSLLCQAANLRTHLILRNLRPSEGKGGYQIPHGFLFEYVTCANYFTEICGWIGFNVATQSVAGYLFLLAGFYQMTVWAIAKHRRLKKLFDGKDGRPKYPRRWIIFPPFF